MEEYYLSSSHIVHIRGLRKWTVTEHSYQESDGRVKINEYGIYFSLEGLFYF